MTQLSNLVADVKYFMTLSDQQMETAVASMIARTKRYVEDSKLQSLVIGVSGGLDSATVSAILQESNIGVPLLGLSIPMNSSDDHREKAKWVGEEYCSTFREFTWWNGYSNDFYDETILDTVGATVEGNYDIAVEAGFEPDSFSNEILQGNIKARLRMITLYDLARRTNGMVLSTDNLSEYLAGFWTINGDVGDWGIIQNIWKGFELPQIARYLGVREDIITQKPSDGLSVTEEDNDEAQLGMTYQEFDTIISIHTKTLNADDVTLHNMYNELWSIDAYSEDGKKILAAVDRWSGTEYKRTGTINLTREEVYG